ncbi:MAG: SurA N-terminal domain-containing protein [Cytophagales bacterium]|nr:SurA N-terminal domain-containing protein [Cytophagales bacterium]
MIKNIRKHSKLVIWLFVIVSLAFISEEGLMYFIRYKDRKDIVDGDMFIIDGERIKYSEFKRRFDERMGYLSSTYGFNISPKDSFWSRYVRNEIVSDMTNNVAYKHIANNLGLQVGHDEIIDIVQGQNISESIKNSFKNKDGAFDKSKLMEFLNNMSKKKDSQDYWKEIEQQIRQDRNKEKLQKLLENMSVYTLLEAEKDWEYDNTKFDVEYLYVPYSTIDDKDCPVSEQILEEYLKNNEHDFHGDEVYKLQYFIADYKLSEDDIKNNTNMLEPLRNKFSGCSNPLEFAKIKSDKDLDRDIKCDNSIKLVYKDLPAEVKDKKDLKVGDTFITIATTIKEANKIYRITNIENDNKKPEEKSYDVNVIYKKPFINKNEKDKVLNALTTQLKKVEKIENFDELAKTLDVKIKKKSVKIDENNIDGVDNTRSFIHDLIKNYKNPKKNGVFIIKPFHNEQGVFCGIVTKHLKKGTKDLEEVREDVNIQCVKNLKKEKIMEKINTSLPLPNASFEEIKNKKIDFIKIGTDKDFSHKSTRLKDYGRVKLAFDKLFTLNKNNVVPFYQDDSGVIMIKIVDKKHKPFDINDTDCKKFYEDKQKSRREMKNITDLFKKRFVFVDNQNIFI